MSYWYRYTVKILIQYMYGICPGFYKPELSLVDLLSESFLPEITFFFGSSGFLDTDAFVSFVFAADDTDLASEAVDCLRGVPSSSSSSLWRRTDARDNDLGIRMSLLSEDGVFMSDLGAAGFASLLLGLDFLSEIMFERH